MKNEYIIYLKNGLKVKIWFMGNLIEKIFKDYDVKFEKVKRGKK